MAKSFLAKKAVRQILKRSFGVGLPNHWDFEYMGSDSIYLSYNISSSDDYILRLCPLHSDEMVCLTLLTDGSSFSHRIFVLHDGSYQYIGATSGDVLTSLAYADALEVIQ